MPQQALHAQQSKSDDMSANPHLKRKSSPKLKPKGSKPRHGTAQEAFIVNTRKAIDGDPFFFHKHEWSRIKHGGSRHSCLAQPKKISVDCFCVKDCAAWIPHLIIPDCMPSCPRCLSKVAVDVTNAEWVENPKMMCGVCSHRHIDAKCCTCHECKKPFAGWHEATLRQDAEETSGVMNFRLSKGFAVDEELCTYIVTHTNDTAASMHQKLKKTIADNWTNDAAFCYRAVIGQRAKKRNPNYLDGTNQQSLDKHLAPLEVIPPAAKKAPQLRSSLAHLEEQLEGAIAKASRDVQFIDMFNKKKNCDKTGPPFKDIGRENCRLLSNQRILTANELFDCDVRSPAVLESWQDIVQACKCVCMSTALQRPAMECPISAVASLRGHPLLDASPPWQ